MSTDPETIHQRYIGLYDKFTVRRNDGRDRAGGDRAGAEYLVLDLSFDPHARIAARAYAAAVRKDYPLLARDIVKKIGLEAEPQKSAEDLSQLWVSPDVQMPSEEGLVYCINFCTCGPDHWMKVQWLGGHIGGVWCDDSGQEHQPPDYWLAVPLPPVPDQEQGGTRT